MGRAAQRGRFYVKQIFATIWTFVTKPFLSELPDNNYQLYISRIQWGGTEAPVSKIYQSVKNIWWATVMECISTSPL